MKLLPLIWISLILITTGCTGPQKQDSTEKAPAESPQPQLIGSVKKHADGLEAILSTDARPAILATGYEWSEGPLWLSTENKLIWSDVPKNTIYQWSEKQGVSVYLQPSGYTQTSSRGGESGSNGLLLNPEGELILCQHGDRRVAKMKSAVTAPSPEFETLADTFQGRKFNSPNDAAFGPMGHLYFTDPPYGLEKRMEDPAKEIPFQGVYRISPTGETVLMVNELSRPNGIAFSPDKKTCYVANSDIDKAIWMAYDVDKDYNLVNGRVLVDATAKASELKGLPDGLKVNKDGIIFATGPGGVWIMTPEGEHLGTISTEEAISNCTFNQDESVLFMTSHMHVASISLK